MVKSDLDIDSIGQTVVDELLTLTNTHGADHELIDGKNLTYRVASGTLAEFTALELNVLVLPDTSLEDTRDLIKRLLGFIRDKTFELEGNRLDVTASVGICELQEGKLQEEFIKRDDDALYEAKF